MIKTWLTLGVKSRVRRRILCLFQSKLRPAYSSTSCSILTHMKRINSQLFASVNRNNNADHSARLAITYQTQLRMLYCHTLTEKAFIFTTAWGGLTSIKTFGLNQSFKIEA